MDTLFHLAFPVHDFSLAKHFYSELLGCEIGRETERALIINLGNHQIVAHKIEAVLEDQGSIYPRHFGLIFTDKEEFEAFVQQLQAKSVPFEIPLKTRFKGTKVEHLSFFLKDPSNNLLEFKHYTHPSAIFGENAFGLVGET